MQGLFPYQQEGVAFLESRDGSAILADEMGLGKTVQAIRYAARRMRRVLVVCPSSLKYNWSREIERWGTSDALILGTGQDFMLGSQKWVIVSFDVLHRYVSAINGGGFGILIVDEAHYLKNPQTRRTKAVRQLAIPARILITGTPLLNRTRELFPLLNIVAPRKFASYERFVDAYCRERIGLYREEDYCRRTEERLNRAMGGLMIRRLKRDVLDQLPDKTRSMIPVDLPERQMRIYRDHIRQAVERLWTTRDDWRAHFAENIVHLNAAKQAASFGKIEPVIALTEDILAAGEKAIVFSQYLTTIENIRNHFGARAVTLTGSDAAQKRSATVDRFQTDPGCRVFVGSLLAAGVGLTLTAASKVVFCDLAWNSAIHAQAEDRVHRVGQKNAVNSYYVLANQTIEEKIYGLLERKQRLFESVIDGRHADNCSVVDEIVAGLIAEREKKPAPDGPEQNLF